LEKNNYNDTLKEEEFVVTIKIKTPLDQEAKPRLCMYMRFYEERQAERDFLYIVQCS
jgi:hypothetical protein